ncbi:MAG: iron chelate uptake ABC transporter family permease subunit [Microbacterium sp.]
MLVLGADRSAPASEDVRWRRVVATRHRSRRLRVDTALVGVAIAAAVVALGLGLGLGLGDYPVSPLAAVQTLIGQGTHAQWTVVVEWRMPVLIAAMSFGTLLGVSGDVFQSLTRNPLGSPDVIGFDAGSYTAVVTVVLLVGATGYWAIAAAAITGGLLTAVVVYALAYRRGVQGFRLIVVGIAVSAMLGAINSYLITRADVNDAIAVGFWGAGTLTGVRWESLGPSLLLGGVVLIALAALSRELRQLELGDEAAVTQGVHAGRSRALLLLCGVAATAVVTAAAGPNACGKSTLLRGLSRLLRPRTGQVLLDGSDIHGYRAKEVARRLGLLPQSSLAPDGITVTDLVARGRYPYQSVLRRWSTDDERAVAAAIAATGIEHLGAQPVDELSGGQRQRAWVAMALAQETDILLLDEPTTFLDIAHQIELLELLTDLRHAGRTLVAVLHDLNQAARYASHLIAMSEGRIVAQGTPADVLTVELVEAVFGLRCIISPDPVSGTPQVVPLGRDRGARAATP